MEAADLIRQSGNFGLFAAPEVSGYALHNEVKPACVEGDDHWH